MVCEFNILNKEGSILLMLVTFVNHMRSVFPVPLFMRTFAIMLDYSSLIIDDYDYDLPEARIARYPLAHRDDSKLLCCRDGNIADHAFKDIVGLLPADAAMVFNDTRVVPARMHFRRDTGASIEIFCLEPHFPLDYGSNFACTSSCSWKCIIGNAKRWKGDSLSLVNYSGDEAVDAFGLKADLESRDGQTGVVRFSWEGGVPFSRVMESCGNIPIPPYLNRDTEEVDHERYQTAYAHVRGSVAAPTAGLHFTPELLAAIRDRGIDEENICLHVGAGTFLPVKNPHVSEHPMHREQFSVSLKTLERLVSAKSVVAVGTTSVRTIESLYYVGAGIIEGGGIRDVGQWEPYERDFPYATEEALGAIVSFLKANGMDSLNVGTRIIIVPGFRFRLTDVLVTNFHQPRSTLLLLVSAFVGGGWRRIYDHALSADYRFLSYGDSSLLWRDSSKSVGGSPMADAQSTGLTGTCGGDTRPGQVGR